jgi:hypothetical protein
MRNGKPAPGTGQSIVRPNPAEDRYIKNEIDHCLDELTELWAAMEGKLLGMQPPRQIACAYDSITDEDGESVGAHYLGIQRHGTKWRVCHASVTYRDPQAGDWKPITDCDIATRVKAADHVKQLEREVEETGRKFLPGLKLAIQKLRKRLESRDDDE